MKLSFDPVFGDDILSAVKCLTLRTPTRERQADIFDPLTLELATDGAPRNIGVAPCVARARLVLAPTGVARVLALTTTPGEAGDRLATILSGLEQSDARAASCLAAFLPAAGFASYDGLYRYHLQRNQAEGRRTPRGRVQRELIGWGVIR